MFAFEMHDECRFLAESRLANFTAKLLNPCVNKHVATKFARANKPFFTTRDGAAISSVGIPDIDKDISIQTDNHMYLILHLATRSATYL